MTTDHWPGTGIPNNMRVTAKLPFLWFDLGSKRMKISVRWQAFTMESNQTIEFESVFPLLKTTSRRKKMKETQSEGIGWRLIAKTDVIVVAHCERTSLKPANVAFGFTLLVGTYILLVYCVRLRCSLHPNQQKSPTNQSKFVRSNRVNFFVKIIALCAFRFKFTFILVEKKFSWDVVKRWNYATARRARSVQFRRLKLKNWE